MDIVLFAYANNKDEIKVIFEKIIKGQNKYIEHKEYIHIEHYWKIEELYKLEVRLAFNSNFGQGEVNNFLNSISDKWTYEEDNTCAIASKTTDGCKYLISEVYMIIIYFT